MKFSPEEKLMILARSCAGTIAIHETPALSHGEGWFYLSFFPDSHINEETSFVIACQRERVLELIQCAQNLARENGLNIYHKVYNQPNVSPNPPRENNASNQSLPPRTALES